jgi:catechol 2,3-dioxygenase
MIKIERIGHLVISVRDLKKSLDFYTRVLGLRVMGEIPGVAFLSAGGRDHHEIALAEIGPDTEKARINQVGLVHFAFRLRTEEDLVEAYETLQREGAQIAYTVNHGVTKSVYFLDPDGHELEVYVDNAPEAIAAMENPYFGLEKLAFAPEQPSLMEAIAKMQQELVAGAA